MASSSVGVLLVLLVAVFSSSTRAFLFNRGDSLARADGREIDDECLALADQGSCEFYSCFERRLPCGRDWYILRQGLYYCNKIEREMESFPEEAQVFLRDSQRCLTTSLKDSYREDSLSCHDLEHQAVNKISECYMDNAFCSVMIGNFARFFQIYEVNDLMSTGAGKVWREIVEMAFQCGGEALGSITVNAQLHFNQLMGSVADEVGDHLDSVGQHLESVGDQIQNRWNSISDSVRSRFSGWFGNNRKK